MSNVLRSFWLHPLTSSIQPLFSRIHPPTTSIPPPASHRMQPSLVLRLHATNTPSFQIEVRQWRDGFSCRRMDAWLSSTRSVFPNTQVSVYTDMLSVRNYAHSMWQYAVIMTLCSQCGGIQSVWHYVDIVWQFAQTVRQNTGSTTVCSYCDSMHSFCQYEQSVWQYTQPVRKYATNVTVCSQCDSMQSGWQYTVSATA